MTVETSKAPATPWWTMTPEAAATELSTGLDGVTAAEAAGKTGARLTTVNASNFLSTEMFATFLSPYTIAILSP